MPDFFCADEYLKEKTKQASTTQTINFLFITDDFGQILLVYPDPSNDLDQFFLQHRLVLLKDLSEIKKTEVNSGLKILSKHD